MYVKLCRCSVVDNDGFGLYYSNGYGNINVIETTIANNSNGGVYIAEMYDNQSVTLQQTTIYGNAYGVQCSGRCYIHYCSIIRNYGFGISCLQADTCEVIGTNVTDNTINLNDDIQYVIKLSATNATLTDCIVMNNNLYYGEYYYSSSCIIYVNDSTIFQVCSHA